MGKRKVGEAVSWVIKSMKTKRIMILCCLRLKITNVRCTFKPACPGKLNLVSAENELLKISRYE